MKILNAKDTQVVSGGYSLVIDTHYNTLDVPSYGACGANKESILKALNAFFANPGASTPICNGYFGSGPNLAAIFYNLGDNVDSAASMAGLTALNTTVTL